MRTREAAKYWRFNFSWGTPPSQLNDVHKRATPGDHRREDDFKGFAAKPSKNDPSYAQPAISVQSIHLRTFPLQAAVFYLADDRFAWTTTK